MNSAEEQVPSGPCSDAAEFRPGFADGEIDPRFDLDSGFRGVYARACDGIGESVLGIDQSHEHGDIRRGDPRLDIGQIGLREGALTAASDVMEIEIFGPGGHTARPHLTIDLTRVMGRVLTDLPDAVVVAADTSEQVTVVFGTAHAGDAANVIPARAVLRGSVRTTDTEVAERMEKLVETELGAILDPTGASWRLNYRRGFLPS